MGLSRKVGWESAPRMDIISSMRISRTCLISLIPVCALFLALAVESRPALEHEEQLPLSARFDQLDEKPELDETGGKDMAPAADPPADRHSSVGSRQGLSPRTACRFSQRRDTSRGPPLEIA
jgi:hypothetical protein